MIRKIIHIDQEKCNGCGACANACHEGAIQMVDGKAALIRDDYCDGLGDCLPACPTGAITFEEREAAAYDHEAVQKHLAAQGKVSQESQLSHQTKAPQESQLSQWPVQIKLAPLTAPYFDQAHLLIAADCTAYAYASFHQDFIRGRVTLIGCPKLDAVDYTEKLTQILRQNSIKSLTIVRMEVPCCGGLEHAATQALKASGRFIPWQVMTIGIDGRILENK
ncbi:4Fe-4S binding protein [Massilistercora timonensis]|uniref:ATP-binding protein n=1 Tax=Massilistercora timonensis TaxID=2086584 RepID=UPI00320B9F51